MSPPFEEQGAAGSGSLLEGIERIHIVGVGGSGMSAIAEVLIGKGFVVSGSDLNDSAPLRRLAERGLAMHIGHHAEQVDQAELVARSTAIPDSNPEVLAADAAGVPVVSRAEILRAITDQFRTVSVAGTHGKTTTSAMLTAALQGSGFDPAYIVGGDLRDLGHGAAVGADDLLVVEADESDGTFVELSSSAVVVTNVEPDHLEHYGGFEGLEDAFVQFLQQCPGPRVVCSDDPGSARLAESDPESTTYGFSEGATWRIVDPLPTPAGITFSVVGPQGRSDIRLRQPGMHNARNATAALAMAVALGSDQAEAADALSAFGGVGRRFEQRGEAAGITLVDDYAHLPTEVAAALDAGRSTGPDRLVAVFQPHRYSRTDQLWSTFGDAFVDADVLFVTGIYAAGEAPRPGITAELIADEVLRSHPDADVRYVESVEDLADRLVEELQAGDLCMTLGAGDLTLLPDRLLPRLG